MAIILLFFCYFVTLHFEVLTIIKYFILKCFSSYFVKNEVIFIEFSKNLKEIRKLKGFSQEEFAEIIGLSHKTYRNYEQGMREPKFEILEKIKIALNCSYDDLLK